MTQHRLVCNHCGRTAEVSALGTTECYAGVVAEVKDGRIVMREHGRVETEDSLSMDIDFFQCDLCEAQEFELDKLVRVIHSWSPEWMEGGDGKAHREAARPGPEQDT